MFFKIGVLKNFPQLTRKIPVLESLFNKISRSKEMPAHVFFYQFCELLELLWWSWILSLKKFYAVRLWQKVFWMASYSNKFLSSKSYLHSPCISNSCFSIFWITLFFLPKKFLNTALEERTVQWNYQEVPTKKYFCRFIGEIIWYERCFMKYCVRVVLNFWKLVWEFLWCLRTRKVKKLFLL